MKQPPRGVQFGDPKHPWRYSTEHASKAGKIGAAKSPWRKFRLPGTPTTPKAGR